MEFIATKLFIHIIGTLSSMLLWRHWIFFRALAWAKNALLTFPCLSVCRTRSSYSCRQPAWLWGGGGSLFGCFFYDALSVTRLYSVCDRMTSEWWWTDEDKHPYQESKRSRRTPQRTRPLGPHCSNTLLRNNAQIAQRMNGLRSNDDFDHCNNDLHDVTQGTPLKFQCTPKSSLFSRFSVPFSCIIILKLYWTKSMRNKYWVTLIFKPGFFKLWYTGLVRKIYG
jgi:hypothetical protein